MKKIKVAEAILTKDNVISEKMYRILEETDKTIVIRIDGFNVRKHKSNFFIKDNNDVKNKNMKVIAKDNKFKNLTKGKTYVKLSELGGFTYIINDLGKKSKYSSNYFKEIEEIKKIGIGIKEELKFEPKKNSFNELEINDILNKNPLQEKEIIINQPKAVEGINDFNLELGGEVVAIPDDINVPKIKSKPIKKEEKGEIYICKYSINNLLFYNRPYIAIKETNDTITVKNDKGETKPYLKIRFVKE